MIMTFQFQYLKLETEFSVVNKIRKPCPNAIMTIYMQTSLLNSGP